MRKRKQQIECPRCGRPGTPPFVKIVANNRYYMIYHGRDGKRQLVCYLSPVEKYKHTSLAYAFPLRGLNYPEREGLTTAHMNIVRGFAKVLKGSNNNVPRGKMLEHLKKVAVLLINIIGDENDTEVYM